LLAFTLFSIVMLPVTGVVASSLLPPDVVGVQPEDLPATATAVDEGVYVATSEAITYEGLWHSATVSAATVGTDEDITFSETDEVGAQYSIGFNGQQVVVTYHTGPQQGIWNVLLDGEPLLEDGEPATIDGYSSTVRYDVTRTFQAEEVGEH